ncbi:hypothetical protein CKG00_06390 [Morganella morganii]|uniref:Uncharacterized protein n=1 Tax=Morganella morganii TaxID=582 RepID=A0A433ZVC0_MORMO|nr:hypothetical protein CKG00_06390 [Morganella morganii]
MHAGKIRQLPHLLFHKNILFIGRNTGFVIPLCPCSLINSAIFSGFSETAEKFALYKFRPVL